MMVNIYWLVVTGTMEFLDDFPVKQLGMECWEWNFIIPTDEHSIIFQVGVGIYHQADHVLVKSEHDLERDERLNTMESTWPVCEWDTFVVKKTRRIEPVSTRFFGPFFEQFFIES